MLPRPLSFLGKITSIERFFDEKTQTKKMQVCYFALRDCEVIELLYVDVACYQEEFPGRPIKVAPWSGYETTPTN